MEAMTWDLPDAPRSQAGLPPAHPLLRQLLRLPLELPAVLHAAAWPLSAFWPPLKAHAWLPLLLLL